MQVLNNVKRALLGDVTQEKENPILERRYEEEPYSEPGKTEEFRKKILNASMQNLKSMQSKKNRPKAMAYFDKIVTGSREEEIKKSGKKVLGYFCSFIPEEILYAADVIPIRLCAGSFDTMDVAEGILPRDVCPMVKSSFGFKVLGLPLMELCEIAVVPTSCDAKKKMGYYLADYMPVWMLHLPHKKDSDKSVKLWLEEMYDFKDAVEKFAGKKISKKALEDSTKLLRKRTDAFRRFLELRKAKLIPISEKDFLLVVYVSFFDDAERWTKNVSLLCDEIEKNIERGIGVHSKDTIRLLLTGSATIWPNFKILDIIEKAGMAIAVDQSCVGTWHLYEPVEVEEYSLPGLMQAIAERYLSPSICPCFTVNDDRFDNLTELIKAYEVDGVIYHILRLCQLFDMEAETVKKILEKENIPMLKVVTDYSKEDVGQLSTRIEAFKEMILIREEGEK